MEANVIGRIVVLLSLLHGLAFVDRTMIGGLLPLIRQDIAMSDVQAGWVIGTAFALPYGMTALVIAALVRGQRASVWWLVAGVIVWTAASLATAAAQSIGTLTLARAGLGVGQAMFVPVAIAWLVDAAGPGGRARALSLFTSGSTIGRSASLITVGALLSLLAAIWPGSGATHWRWPFVITALPNLVLLPMLAGLGKSGPSGLRPDDGIGPGAAHRFDDDIAQSAIDWSTLILFFVVAIMPVLLIQAVSGWLPTLFVRDHGLAPARAATLLGVVTLVAAPAGQILGGWLMTRHRSWHPHIPAIVLGGLLATLVPLAALALAPGTIAAVASVVAMTLTLGIASFCGLFGVQALIPQSARATVNGVYLAFVTLVAVGVGPVLAGGLATVSGTAGSTAGSTALGGALLATGVIASGVCAVAVVAVRRRYRRQCAA